MGVREVLLRSRDESDPPRRVKLDREGKEIKPPN